MLLLAACDSAADIAVPPVTAPDPGVIADASLQGAIEDVVGRALAAPVDDRLRAELGVLYEANQIWTLAAEAYQNAYLLNSNRADYANHAVATLRRAGRALEADDILLEAASHFSDNASLRDRLGEWKLLEGDAEGALEDFRAVSQLAPWFVAGPVAEAEALIALERFAEALKRAEDTLAERPGSRRAHYVRGLALRGLGRLPEAEAALTLGEGALRSYVPDELSERVRFAIYDSRILLRAVEDLRAKGEEGEITRMLEQGVERSPDVAVLWNALGSSLRRQNQAERAAKCFDRAIELDSSAVEFRTNAALASLTLGRNEDARAMAESGVALDDDNLAARVVLARCYMADGNRAAALPLLERSYAQDSTSYMAAISLGEVCYETGQLERARELLEKLHARSPEKYWPTHFLCLSRLKLGLVEEARMLLEQIRKRFPEDSRIADLEAAFL